MLLEVEREEVVAGGVAVDASADIDHAHSFFFIIYFFAIDMSICNNSGSFPLFSPPPQPN